jgi:hypothetical protein
MNAILLLFEFPIHTKRTLVISLFFNDDTFYLSCGRTDGVRLLDRVKNRHSTKIIAIDLYLTGRSDLSATLFL